MRRAYCLNPVEFRINKKTVSENFSRIYNSVWVKNFLNAAHQIQIRFAHGQRHIRTFSDADAVFPGKRSAEFYRQFKNFPYPFRNLVFPTALVDVFFQNIDMQISVAQMSEANGIEAVALSDFFDAR